MQRAFWNELGSDCYGPEAASRIAGALQLAQNSYFAPSGTQVLPLPPVQNAGAPSLVNIDGYEKADDDVSAMLRGESISRPPVATLATSEPVQSQQPLVPQKSKKQDLPEPYAKRQIVESTGSPNSTPNNIDSEQLARLMTKAFLVGLCC